MNIYIQKFFGISQFNLKYRALLLSIKYKHLGFVDYYLNDMMYNQERKLLSKNGKHWRFLLTYMNKNGITYSNCVHKKRNW